MAAGYCFLYCMRYNPSQASRLLLDPLISDSTAKLNTDIGGFVHSGFSKRLSPAPERRYGHAQSVFLLPEVRISPENCPATSLPHHKAVKYKFESGHKTKLNQRSAPPQGSRKPLKFTFSHMTFPDVMIPNGVLNGSGSRIPRAEKSLSGEKPSDCA